MNIKIAILPSYIFNFFVIETFRFGQKRECFWSNARTERKWKFNWIVNCHRKFILQIAMWLSDYLFLIGDKSFTNNIEEFSWQHKQRILRFSQFSLVFLLFDAVEFPKIIKYVHTIYRMFGEFTSRAVHKECHAIFNFVAISSRPWNQNRTCVFGYNWESESE